MEEQSVRHEIRSLTKRFDEIEEKLNKHVKLLFEKLSEIEGWECMISKPFYRDYFTTTPDLLIQETEIICYDDFVAFIDPWSGENNTVLEINLHQPLKMQVKRCKEEENQANME